MKLQIPFCLLLSLWLVQSATAQNKQVIVIVGAAGETQYGEQFEAWANKWKLAIESADSFDDGAEPPADRQQPGSQQADSRNADSQQADPQPPDRGNAGGQEKIRLTTIGIQETNDSSDFDQIKNELLQINNSNPNEIWIVLIGHGTFDSKTAKFNLRGRDLSAAQLNQWLAPMTCPTVIINCASASGPFINQLAAPNRIVLTSTKSGFQHNFSRFGEYLAESIGDPAIDLDKDQQTSLLEAFVAASAKTQEFYVQENRLATELALIDDNGDGKGTPADWFQGTRATQKPKDGEADGLFANQVFLFRRGADAELTTNQLKIRNQLEQQLEDLRERRSNLDEDQYYRLLEPIMLELAKIYQN